MTGRHCPSVWKAFRKGIADWYDKMGLMVAINLLWTLPVTLATGLAGVLIPLVGYPLSLTFSFAVAFFGGSYFWTAACLSAQRTSDLEGPSIRDVQDVWRTYRTNWLKLTTMQFVVSAVLIVDLVFFVIQDSVAFRIAGVVVSYITLLWFCSLLWQASFLVLENASPLKVFRKSILVTLDNPLFTLGLLLVTILVSVVLVPVVIPVLLVLIGALACIINRAHRELLLKYGIVQPEPERIIDSGWPESDEPPRRLNPRGQSRG